MDRYETAKLLPSDGAGWNYFGNFVGISGDNIIVGSGNSSAYVYTKPGTGWTNATQTAILTASDVVSDDWFANSVSISGDNIILGAERDDDSGTDCGSAYVFIKPVTGWTNTTQTEKLIASDGAAGDYFGHSVSISGDNIVIGAYYDDDNGTNSGSAYLFTLSCSTSSTINLTVCNSYTSPSGNYTWTNSGTFLDTIPNIAGCDSLITIDLTVNTVDTSVTENGITLTANTLGATYQWLDCDNSYSSISGETGQSFTATVNGNYAVEITENGCTDTSFCYSITSVGINEQYLQQDIEIYPNPTTGIISISGKNIESIEIVNIEGQIIKLIKWNNEKCNIDLSPRPKGIYLIKIITYNGIIIRKIVLE